MLKIIEIGKTLGKGTFGKVKLGTHLITKEKVRSVKVS
jgi:serine/threonine protein kinase